MRRAFAGLLLASAAALASSPSRAFTDAELIDGFDRTVFGSEYATFGWQAWIVKKYVDPVRVFIDDRSGLGKAAAVARFVRSLPAQIADLDIAVVGKPEAANFHIYIVDRSAYHDVVAKEVYGEPSSSFSPGQCLVRVVSTGDGISRSDAVIVADKGDFLFRRCMIEETLQGLGPINDDPTLDASVFNDASQHSTFTDFDRHILNMLYDPLVRPGMTHLEVKRVLPEVAAAVQKRLR
jgi:hypothetical protein